MHAPTLTGMGVTAGILILAIGVGLLSTPAIAEDAEPIPMPTVKGVASKKSGLIGCQSCHAPQTKDKRSQELIDYVQFTTWDEKDFHRCAYEALFSDLGRQMNRLLKPSRGPNYDVASDVSCLACHATDYAMQPVGKKEASDFDTSAGVQCEACHGRSDDWLAKHFRGEWRDTTPTDKAKFGLVDLRDPTKRAQLCVTCHVGSPVEGKVITHEMYAAGHPPLPAFELLSYSHDEPRHWRLPSQVPYITDLAKRDPKAAWELYHYSEKDHQPLRLVVVGAIVGFQQAMHLVGDAAKQCLPNAEGESALLDYAHFDCYACHHDLRYPSKRQQYGYNGTAGRPVMRGATLLLRAVTEHADVSGTLLTELDQSLENLRRAFDARPFGDPKKIVAAMAQFDKWSATALNTINEKTYDAESSKQLITKLMNAGIAIPSDVKRSPFDPEGARQLAAAFNRLLRDELGRQPTEQEMRDGIVGGELGDTWESELDKLGKMTSIMIRPTDRCPCQEGPISKGLEARTKLLYDFDPDAVGASFKSLLSGYRGKK